MFRYEGTLTVNAGGIIVDKRAVDVVNASPSTTVLSCPTINSRKVDTS
jgi:hypothetical protein